ncbi:DNA circularization protein [Photorhabdus temperata]|uniref:Mu-like prophage DNA circulation protein n=1 Tax=Photorhabdus temperata subsp. temperata Meg1 TaxID=1393735 RepID=A0A081RR82_PHOTE|nr:DNA circularization N-terminal domain-containing protein [Photorhabdus temperata]KER01185.1 Mu-like prophage DNA circulation protein [Photorhabdus temperata subsp. temperata Meg1]
MEIDFDQVMTLFNDNSWRSRVGNGKGTFRGQTFYIIDDATISGGRRVVRHEYPLRDDGETEDMGLTTREYAFTAVVFGDDYFSQRDALITVLEAPEPGEIDHPYFGKQQIQIETYTVRESCYTGGVAMFSVTFVPAADKTAPVEAHKPELNSDSLTSRVLSDITAAWGTVTGAIAKVTDTLNTVEATVNTLVNGIRSLPATSGMNQLLGSALALKGSLKNLINAPHQLFDDIANLVSGMAEVAPPAVASRALRKAGSSIQVQSKPNVPAVAHLQHVVNTPTTVFIAAQLAKLVLTAATEAAKTKPPAPALTLAGTPYTVISQSSEVPVMSIPLIETLDDTRKTSTQLDDELMQLLIATGDLGWFETSNQLRDFRITFVLQMQATAGALPTARHIALAGTEPALVTLYRETGEGRQLDRFIRRNGIRHPAFVTGGVDIEVING